MNRSHGRHRANVVRWATTGLALACALSLGVSLARAQAGPLAGGGGFDLSWWTADGGGGALSGGSYQLLGSTGQPDAGRMTGGGYTLAGGFWAGGTPAEGAHRIYLPVVLRAHP